MATQSLLAADAVTGADPRSLILGIDRASISVCVRFRRLVLEVAA